MSRFILTVMVIIMILFVIPAPALAYDSYHTGPREENYYVRFNEDQNASYTMTFNLSNSACTHLFNFNQTVSPFMNNTSIVGTFTGPWMPPSLITYQNGSAIYALLSSITKFQSNQVMSGSSYSWWRVPLDNPFVTSCQLKIWKVENPNMVNWTGTAPSRVPISLCHPTLVWNNIYNLKSSTELNKTHYWWNGTTEWNYSHKMAWVRVVAPLHSDISYVYQWTLSLVSSFVRIYMSLNDIGEDSIYKSWIQTDSGANIADADLDCSVIHQYGMGDAVSGFEVAANSSLHFYSQLGIPRQSIGRGGFLMPSHTWIKDGECLTFMMPFIFDATNTSNIHVNITSFDGHWWEDYWVATDGGTDFTVHSVIYDDLIDNSVCSIFHINVTFQNETNLIFIYDPITIWDPSYDDEGVYATHRFRVIDDPNFPDNPYIYFKPYHSLQITAGIWMNTYVYPISILDGKVIDPQVLRLFDASEYYRLHYKWEVGWNDFKDVILHGYIRGAILDYLGIGNGEILAAWFDISPKQLRDDVARAIRIVGYALYQLGGYIVAAGKWFADNSSYVFAAMFFGLGLLIFVPIWLALVSFNNRIKNFFLVLARDGPEDAADFAARFWPQTMQEFNKLPVVRGARRIAEKGGDVGGRVWRRIA